MQTETMINSKSRKKLRKRKSRLKNVAQKGAGNHGNQLCKQCRYSLNACSENQAPSTTPAGPRGGATIMGDAPQRKSPGNVTEGIFFSAAIDCLRLVHRLDYYT